MQYRRFLANNIRYLFSITLFAWHSVFSLPTLTQEPPTVGNFSLENSQQPGPFFSFGQNIVDKNQVLLSVNPSYSSSQSQKIFEYTPSLLYGLSDKASVMLTLPIALEYTNNNQNFSGIGDLGLDLEYAFYHQDTKQYSDEATIIFAPSFPTSNLDQLSKRTDPSNRVSGFSRKNAPSSFDTISYFAGATYSRTAINWYGFISPGILLFNKHSGIQQGIQYFYNAGIGHIFSSQSSRYIFSGLLEFNGQMSEKTSYNKLTVPNTGGNIIYITPSVWFSTKAIVVQVGVSLPIQQSWYGNQSNFSYFTGGIITWTFQ